MRVIFYPETGTCSYGFVSLQACTRHPDAHRLDMKNFINRPIPRLLRYELLLKDIMANSAEGHEDHDAIPGAIEAIKSLGKETEPGVQDAKTKVELWRYNANLVFKHGETFVSFNFILMSCRAVLIRIRLGYGSPRREATTCSFREATAPARWWP